MTRAVAVVDHEVVFPLGHVDEALKKHPAVSAQLRADEIERLLDPTGYVGLSTEFVDKVLSAIPADFAHSPASAQPQVPS